MAQFDLIIQTRIHEKIKNFDTLHDSFAFGVCNEVYYQRITRSITKRLRRFLR